MLLTIDLGNTNIVFGVFDGTRLVRSWRLATRPESTADELGVWMDRFLARERVDHAQVDSVVMASVVPPLTGTMIEAVQKYFSAEPFVIDGDTDTGMPVLYDTPAEVGADRIVNGVAAFERYGRPSARPVIVVDFGTATTFDAITARGEYLGGVICPGVRISADALFQRAAKLPRIDIRRPPSVIGRNTVSSMQSGLFWGYIGLVEGIVHRMRAELGGEALSIATGGLAELVAPDTHVIEAVERDLTLHGLRMIWERNHRWPSPSPPTA